MGKKGEERGRRMETEGGTKGWRDQERKESELIK